MTHKTNGTLRDDSDMIEALRELSLEWEPALRDDQAAILAAGRRSRRRRHAFEMATSGIAVASITVLALAAGHTVSNDRPIAISPLGSGTDSRDAVLAQDATNQAALRKALGDDFTIDDEGNTTVKRGSPSAEGLPIGLEDVTTQLFTLGPGEEDLAEFCAPLVEKNVIFAACTERASAGGQSVYVRESHAGPGGARLGNGDHVTGEGVRVLFVQADGTIVVVDLSTKELESNSTPERRAAAKAWLDRMTPRLMNAATDPSVRDPGLRLGPRQKPSPSP